MDDRSPPTKPPLRLRRKLELNWDPDATATLTQTGAPNTRLQQIGSGPRDGPSVWTHMNFDVHSDISDRAPRARERCWRLTRSDISETKDVRRIHRAAPGADDLPDVHVTAAAAAPAMQQTRNPRQRLATRMTASATHARRNHDSNQSPLPQQPLRIFKCHHST